MLGMQSSGSQELQARALYICGNMVRQGKAFAEAIAAPFEFKDEEGRDPIKLNGIELLSVVLHTSKDDGVKRSCTEVSLSFVCLLSLHSS
jgi:hypothetical protein